MCGRFNLRLTPAERQEFFDVAREVPQFPPRYNIAPTQPSTYEDELTKAHWTAAEMKMTKALLTSMQQKRFEIGDYHDLYAERLQALAEVKVQGQELVSSPESQDAPPVIKFDGGVNQPRDSRPPKRTKASARPAARKRKSA
ncbi:MAG: hypothetical protein SH850_21610 [Planctomycetaceae bacterium]|nr:hypothetical protein [Planctomycetaceae bacterium]